MKKKINVLILGSGGREHALCYGIAKSNKLAKLYISPGNGGTNEFAKNVNLNIKIHSQIINFIHNNDINFVIIGSEEPLVNGLASSLRAANILCFGPSRDAAKIEGSKSFMKDLCYDFNIPTAKYKKFNNALDAKNFIKLIKKLPLVIKNDGLANGKGVLITNSINEANNAIDTIFNTSTNLSATKIIIEEFIIGEEISFFALINGVNVIPMIGVQDHKTINEGGKGFNTGGMGAYSPVPILNNTMTKRIINEIIIPTANGMVKRNIAFEGVLFAGLIITKNGPKLIEYNVRFGDPEFQVIIKRLKSDILEILLATSKNCLNKIKINWSNRVALNIVIAAKGYPFNYKKGNEIKKIKSVNKLNNITVFHAGTKKINNKIITNGGRILNIVATANNVKEAAKIAYNAVKNIKLKESFYRKDIGYKAILHENKNI